MTSLTLWDVLVACSTGVIDAADVAPVPCFGQLCCVKSFFFMRARVSPEKEWRKRKLVSNAVNHDSCIREILKRKNT